MHTSYQGIPSPARRRSAALGVAAMLLLAGLLAATVVVPGAVATNGKAPVPTEAVFLDVDNDGYLDGVEVTFGLNGGAALIDATVQPQDFRVKVGTETITPHGCLVVVDSGVVRCSDDGADMFTLLFAELETLNGALVPTLEYLGGARNTDGHTAAAAASVPATTRATPYFLRAYGSDDSKDVLYWFTEKIKLRSAGETGLDAPTAKNSFCWAEKGSTSGDGSTILIESATISGDKPTAKVTLTAKPKKDNGDLATILPAGTLLLEQTGGCSTGSTNLEDFSATRVSNFADYKPFADPIKLKGAFGSVGSNELVLALDGPIDAPDGEAMTLDKVKAAFTYVNGNNPSNPGATAITGFRHVDDSSRITLLMDQKLTLDDITGTTADKITVVADKLIGAGTFGVASNPVRLQAATNVALTGAIPAEPDPSTVDSRWDNVDIAPRVLHAGTVDVDGNGKLDAIKVRFDQPVTLDATDTPTFSVQNVVAGTVTNVAVSKVVGPASTDKTCPVGDGTTTAAVAPATDEVWLCITPTALDGDATPRVGFDGVGVEDDFGNAAVSFAGLKAADEVGVITVEVRTRDYFDYDDVAAGFNPATGTPPRRANGVIDTLELFFGTGVKVDDGYDGTGCQNLEPQEWRVSHGGVDVPPLFMETYVPRLSERPTGGWLAGSCQSPAANRDGPTVALIIGEGHGWDTGVTPKLDHLGDVDGDGRVLTVTGAGRFPVTTTSIDSIDHANPVIIKASASVGHPQISITFSEPVQGIDGESTRRVLASDLVYVNDNPGGATTITSVTSSPDGSRTIQATTDAAPVPGDLAADGDAVRPKYATGTGGSTHPTGSTIQDLAGNRDPPETPNVPGNKVVYRDFTVSPAIDQVTPVEDNSAPFVQERHAQDGDGDGFIDRVRLKFNENVRGSGTDGCVDADLWTFNIDGGDDDVAATSVVSDPNPATGVDPCAASQFLFVEFDGVAAEAHTDSDILFSYTPPTDGGSGVVDVPTSTSETANPMAPLTDQKALDKAPPVLVKQDGTPVSATEPAEAATLDSDGDGIVDRLRLRFSEPVAEASIKDADWKVTAPARTVTGHTLDGNFLTLHLNVPSNAAVDTALTPTVTYEPTGDDRIRDLATVPNLLSGTRYRDTTETDSELATVDGAAPVILSTGTGLTGPTLTLAFSEPVYNKATVGDPPVAADSIATGHVAYVNNNVGESGDTSKAVDAVDHDATPAVTDDTTPPNVVKVTFDAVPSTGDVDEDRLTLVSIHDAAGNRASAAHTSLDGVSNDVEAPKQIQNLAATAVATATGNEITLTWTDPPADSVRGDDLESLVITIDDPSDSVAAIDITSSANTLSDVPTLPDPQANKAQTLKVTGVESGKTYRFTVRAIDEEGNQGPESTAASVKVPFLDDNAPAAITDLETDGTTGSSVTLKWTAPADTDGEDNAIKVAGYEVRFSTTAITSFTQGEAVPAARLTFDPASLAAAGGIQRATVTGLDADTTYHFAVRAVDARPNAGGFDTVQATTGPLDATPPVGNLVITSSTHPQATATANDAPTFAWSGLTDPDTPITYHYALNQQSAYTVTDQEAQTDRSGSTTGTSKGFTGVADGTWYFHLRGYSQGGSSTTVTYTIIVLDPDDLVDPADIAQANRDLQESVSVERDGDDNVVTWILPETDLEVAGVQVWRSTSPFELAADLDADSAGFDDAEYVDEDASEDALYVVTLYFSKDPTGGQVDSLAQAPGYDTMTEAERAEQGTPVVQPPPPPAVDGPDDDGLPAWLWILIAVGLVGIVAAVVVPVVVTRRRRDTDWQEPSRWDDAWRDDAADAEAGAEGPAHYLECPRCEHGFEVHGEKPLETTCPNCGVRGVLN